jgi:hypothetical protein
MAALMRLSLGAGEAGMPAKKWSAPSIQMMRRGCGAETRVASRMRDEELGDGAAGGQEVVGVVAACGADGKAQADEAADAGVAAAGAEADVGAEGEAGEEQREVIRCGHPVECGADVVDFAAAVVVRAFAQARAAEVEAEDRKADLRESFCRVVDDLVVHGAAAEGVWVGDDGRV